MDVLMVEGCIVKEGRKRDQREGKKNRFQTCIPSQVRSIGLWSDRSDKEITERFSQPIDRSEAPIDRTLN